MWDAADRAALIDPDLPGYAQAVKADLSTVDGLFRNAHGEVFGLVSGTDPSFTCVATAAPAKNDMLTIDSIAYRVTGKRPDGNGFVILDLEKV